MFRMCSNVVIRIFLLAALVLSVHIYVLFESIIYSADLQDVRELLLVSSSAGHITRRRSRIRAARGSEFLDTDGSAYQRGH